MQKGFLRIITFIVLTVLVGAPVLALAETQEELQRQIQDKQAQIQELEKQIAAYNEEIKNQKSLESSLSKQIKSMETQIKQLEAEIKLTKTKISATTLKIQGLSADITVQEAQIQKQKTNLAETIRLINEYDQTTPLHMVMASANFSAILNQVQFTDNLQQGLKEKLDEIKALKGQLEGEKSDWQAQKDSLEDLRDQLSGKNLALDSQKDKKTNLLTETKNQEKKYQQIKTDLEKKQEAIEKEIFALEEKLRLLVNPNSLPGSHSGLLLWPVSGSISQGYGATSQTGFINSAYSFHNGVDFAVKSGTPVKAADSGVVKAMGDNGKYAYGKWIAIDHQNGLITLYAHFSGYAVSVGQKVTRGQTIGYSGNTGFSTGPHLHFTVYATNTFSVESKWYGLLPLGGSVNPMNYL
ncbi:MAG: peptidoglycan DD-metalloendopeptidase family protein [bacterium]